MFGWVDFRGYGKWGEDAERKWFFLEYLVGLILGEKIGGAHCFLSRPTKTFFPPNLERKRRWICLVILVPLFFYIYIFFYPQFKYWSHWTCISLSCFFPSISHFLSLLVCSSLSLSVLFFSPLFYNIKKVINIITKRKKNV